MMDFLKTLTDPHSIIQYGGLGLLLFVIFAETGLLVGFFLPGDNLILLAGILCRTHPELLMHLPLPWLLFLMMLAAISGNVFGYWFGYKTGSSLFKREDTLFFKKSRLELTKKYYDKYGGNLTLIIARFLPVIRTFSPIIAGAIRIKFRIFMVYNVLGAVLWIGSLGTAGYYLIHFFPSLEKNIGYVFIFLIIITAIPIVKALFQKKKNDDG